LTLAPGYYQNNIQNKKGYTMLTSLILSAILSSTSSYNIECEVGTCVETETTEIVYKDGTKRTIEIVTVKETLIDLRTQDK
jgi:hypothetical protein